MALTEEIKLAMEAAFAVTDRLLSTRLPEPVVGRTVAITAFIVVLHENHPTADWELFQRNGQTLARNLIAARQFPTRSKRRRLELQDGTWQLVQALPGKAWKSVTQGGGQFLGDALFKYGQSIHAAIEEVGHLYGKQTMLEHEGQIEGLLATVECLLTLFKTDAWAEGCVLLGKAWVANNEAS